VTDVLAVDLGTGSVRAARYDETGRSLREARRPLRILEPGAGRSEHDPAEVAAAFEAVIAEVASPPPAAICTSAYLHGLVSLDARGEPSGPIQLWSDGRAAAEASSLRRQGLGARFHELTGCPPHPSYPRERLAWAAAHDRRRFEAAARFVSPKAWLLSRLGARLVEDEATASATGLFDLRSRSWSPEPLETAGGLDVERLAPIVPTDTIAGEVSRAAASRTGVRAGTPIVTGSGDGMLAAIGSGSGALSLTVGTSAALRVARGAPPSPAVPALFCYVLGRSSYLLGAASNSGGGVLDWARRRFVPHLASLSPEAFESRIRRTVETPPFDDLLVLPFVRGERAPFYEPGFGFAVGGDSDAASPLDLVAATWRGVATHVALLFEEIVRAAGPESFARIVASGGAFRSALLARTLADAIGHEIEIPEDVEASARGAWLLGRAALGDRSSPPGMPAIARRVVPRREAHDRFVRDRERHRLAIEILRPVWRRLADASA
jgi:gluconokinase